MKRTALHMSAWIGAALLTLVLVLAGILSASLLGRGQLPTGPTLQRAVPDLSRLPVIEVCWLETGRAFGEGPFSMTASGLLVRHPLAHVLIDGGNSSRFDQEADAFPFLMRQIMRTVPGRLKNRISLPDALREVGESPASVRLLLPSHAHLDHVGGYEDLPRIPVLLSDAEMEYLSDRTARSTGAVIPEQARLLLDGRARPLQFRSGPYEVFDQSLDVYGDGSIVVVPMPGHTPGSVGIFINLDRNQRIFYVGDAALQGTEIVKRTRKPFFIDDSQPAAADQEVQRLYTLHKMDPELKMIPAHGRGDFLHAFPNGPESCVMSIAGLGP
jgi:N-acyl homoserine lactone hydrolase